MNPGLISGNTTTATFGGVLLVLCMKTSVHEILHTALLAAIGAIVSFGVSMLLKYILKKNTKK